MLFLGVIWFRGAKYHIKFYIQQSLKFKKPTASVLCLVEKLNEVGGKLIVAGDKKGPASYEAPSGESVHSKSNIPNPSSPNAWPVEFLSLENQLAMPFELARLLPVWRRCRATEVVK